MKKSFINKIIEVFKLFPLNPNRIDEVVYEVNCYCDERVTLKQSNDELDMDSISVEIDGFGILHKKLYIEGDIFEYIVCYDKYKEEDDSYDISVYEFKSSVKKETDEVCECILKWLLTRGKDKTYIPMIINYLPEMADEILLQID